MPKNHFFIVIQINKIQIIDLCATNKSTKFQTNIYIFTMQWPKNQAMEMTSFFKLYLWTL